MTSTTTSAVPAARTASGDEVSLVRLYVLRATYLILVMGLGATIVPGIMDHPLESRGVIPSLLGAVWLLAFLGLRHPLRMLPVLLFELTWKTIWLISYGLPQRTAGQLPPTFADDFPAILAGVILMPLVIPWVYVWRNYVTAPGAPWRRGTAEGG